MYMMDSFVSPRDVSVIARVSDQKVGDVSLICSAQSFEPQFDSSMSSLTFFVTQTTSSYTFFIIMRFLNLESAVHSSRSISVIIKN